MVRVIPKFKCQGGGAENLIARPESKIKMPPVEERKSRSLLMRPYI